MSKAVVGKQAPDIRLPATGGEFHLKAARGSAVVLYFYPRDNTPGCTREGEAFRELHAQFRRAGAVVVGVSTDTLASHEKFKAKMGFPFELAADVEHAAAAAYGVWREKNMYGRKVMGIERSTFLVDAAGVLRAEWRKVKVEGHAEAVLAAVKAL